ncbi:MAG TPA: EamA family transporter [Acidobacteriaceae bacterium]
MFSRIPKSTLVPLAFASVYLFWGSTYAGIHIAGEHLSAPVVSAARCCFAAVMIAGLAWARGKSLRAAPGELWRLALIGVLFMSANNMALTWAEQMVPSGFASLVVSTMPIMIALMESVLPDGERLNHRGWAGTLLGAAGMCVLVWPSIHHQEALPSGSRPVLGVIVLLFAAFSFGVGSVLSRRFRFKTDTFVATGWQLGFAGVFNTVFAVFAGGFRHSTWTGSGTAAVAYLAVFGSLFGLVAFTYLLKNVAVTKIAPYAFVNPLIAVLIGALLLHERLAPAEFAGMAIIVCGVAMVVFSRTVRAKREIVGTAGNAVE